MGHASCADASPRPGLPQVWEHLRALQLTHNELSAKRDKIAADMETASQAELTRLNRRISDLAAVVVAVQDFEAIADEMASLGEMLSDCGEDEDHEMAELVQVGQRHSQLSRPAQPILLPSLLCS